MKSQNYLKTIFDLKGIKEVKPTEDQLKSLNMTPHRFNQIMDNRGVNDLTVSEKNAIENWLWDIFQEDIDILKDPQERESFIDKHKMLKG